MNTHLYLHRFSAGGAAYLRLVAAPNRRVFADLFEKAYEASEIAGSRIEVVLGAGTHFSTLCDDVTKYLELFGRGSFTVPGTTGLWRMPCKDASTPWWTSDLDAFVRQRASQAQSQAPVATWKDRLTAAAKLYEPSKQPNAFVVLEHPDVRTVSLVSFESSACERTADGAYVLDVACVLELLAHIHGASATWQPDTLDLPENSNLNFKLRVKQDWVEAPSATFPMDAAHVCDLLRELGLGWERHGVMRELRLRNREIDASLDAQACRWSAVADLDGLFSDYDIAQPKAWCLRSRFYAQASTWAAMEKLSAAHHPLTDETPTSQTRQPFHLGPFEAFEETAFAKAGYKLTMGEAYTDELIRCGIITNGGCIVLPSEKAVLLTMDASKHDAILKRLFAVEAADLEAAHRPLSEPIALDTMILQSESRRVVPRYLVHRLIAPAAVAFFTDHPFHEYLTEFQLLAPTEGLPPKAVTVLSGLCDVLRSERGQEILRVCERIEAAFRNTLNTSPAGPAGPAGGTSCATCGLCTSWNLKIERLLRWSFLFQSTLVEHFVHRIRERRPWIGLWTASSELCDQVMRYLERVREKRPSWQLDKDRISAELEACGVRKKRSAAGYQFILEAPTDAETDAIATEVIDMLAVHELTSLSSEDLDEVP